MPRGDKRSRERVLMGGILLASPAMTNGTHMLTAWLLSTRRRSRME